MIKKILSLTIILFGLIVWANSSFAIEKKHIKLESNPETLNSDKNIMQAELMEKEVVTFKNNLQNLEAIYDIKNDAIIVKWYNNLNEIIYILRKIQTTKIDKTTADNVIKIVITDLKQITHDIKTYLRVVKMKNESKIDYLKNLATKMSGKIDKITYTFSLYWWKNISPQLNSLWTRNSQLKKFKNVTFKNPREAKETLISIASHIRQSLFEIKKKL